MTNKLTYLKDIVEIRYGYPFDSNLFSDAGKIKVIRIRDVMKGNTELYYNGNCDDYFKIERGDLLITMDGEFKINSWKSDVAYMNQRICRIIPLNNFVDIRFLYFILQNILKLIEDKTPFVTVKHLSSKEINKISFPLPQLAEQKRIAEILDIANRLRHNRKKAIELLDDYLRSVFYDMFGDPVKNEKGWDRKTFDNLIKIDKKQIQPENFLANTIYIDLESIEKNTGVILNKKIIKKGDLKSSKFIFAKEHLLYGKLRPYLNKVANPNFEGICSTDILPISPREGVANKNFVIHLMRLPDFVNYAHERSIGANLPRVNAETICKYLSIMPPIELQNKFAQIVEQVEKTKAKMHESLKEMDNLFNSLMQKAFKV